VNLSRIALKRASDAGVKKFAQHMIDDHEKANKELIKLADQKKFKVSATMDAEHQALSTKLLKLSGSEFDREYMKGQVKDHKDTVALFEKESKNGSDADLKKWADKTLPTLRKHLKMAQDTQSKLTGGTSATKTGKGDR